MPFRPQAPPKKLPIDLASIESRKGGWLVAIQSITETRGGCTLLLGMILEQSINEESFRMRRIEAMVDRSEANDPDKSTNLLERIQEWIETTEGYGFLDLT